MPVGEEINEALVEAIALRVVELLGDAKSRSDNARLVDASGVAAKLGVERDWVYAHAEELGGIRLGGPRGRIRFDLDLVKDRLGLLAARPRRAPNRPAARRKMTRVPLRPKVESKRPNKVAGRRANAPGRDTGRYPDAARR